MERLHGRHRQDAVRQRASAHRLREPGGRHDDDPPRPRRVQRPLARPAADEPGRAGRLGDRVRRAVRQRRPPPPRRLRPGRVRPTGRRVERPGSLPGHRAAGRADGGQRPAADAGAGRPAQRTDPPPGRRLPPARRRPRVAHDDRRDGARPRHHPGRARQPAPGLLRRVVRHLPGRHLRRPVPQPHRADGAGRRRRSGAVPRPAGAGPGEGVPAGAGRDDRPLPGAADVPLGRHARPGGALYQSGCWRARRATRCRPATTAR